jgi:hypothetical protein
MIMMMVGSHLAKIDQLLLPPHAAAAALCCKSNVQSNPPLHITRWGYNKTKKDLVHDRDLMPFKTSLSQF